MEYASLQGDQGILVNSTESDITVAGTMIPAGKIIHNGDTADISEIYNAVSNADNIRVRATSGDDWVDLSKTLFDGKNEFEWSGGNDFYAPSEQGNGVFTPWNFNVSDSVDGSQGLNIDNSTGSLVVTSEHGTFRAENISKFYDTYFSDIFLGSDVGEAFKLGLGGTDVVTGNGGSDRFRISSRNQNSSDFDGYSATITDYETLEEISLEDFGFDTTNWKNELSIVFNPGSDETCISINTQTYIVTDLVKIQGEYVLDNSHIEDDGHVELYLVAAELLVGAIINGTSGNDKLYGYSGNDTLNGFAGDDWLYGGLGDDALDGGDGYDRIDFRGSTAAVVVDFGAGTASGTAIGTDQIVNIERVIGSDFDDTLTGSNTDNDVWESFTGGLGNDIIDGAGGGDYVWYGNSSSAIYVDLSTGVAAGGEGIDQLISIEEVGGSNFADTFLGSEGNDGFQPDALGDEGAGSNFKVGGADIIDGKGGIDTVSYDNTQNDDGFTPSGIVANLLLGTVVDAAGNIDRLSNIENIYGSPYDDNITGDNNANKLEGREENDTLTGGDGNDVINGGDGNDIIYGGDGNDIINDGKGYDIIYGGDGIDTFKRDYSADYGDNAFNAHINLDIGTISSPDYPEDTPDYISNVENVTLEGQFNYTVTGNSTDNKILTSSGEDVIISGLGFDFIDTGAGNDTITLTGNSYYNGMSAHNVGSTTDVATNVKLDLNDKVKLETVVDGGANADTINLGSGSDAFFLHDSFSDFHSSLTLAIDKHADKLSTQRILNVETINGLDGDDIIDLTSPDYSLAGQVITINGGTGNDVIWGSDATETLIGGDGSDTLFGGSGNDTLTGGSGADTFEFTRTAGNDTITDFQSGSDSIKIYSDYTFNVSKTASTTADYSIDDQSDPILYLARGQTYTFEMSGNGHPFYIKSTSSTSGTIR